jgi:hypothetical protein
VGHCLEPMLSDAILLTAEYLLAWMRSIREVHLQKERGLRLTSSLWVEK